MGPVAFGVALGGKLSDHQVASFGEQKETVVVSRDEGGAAALQPAGKWAAVAEDHLAAGDCHNPQVALLMEAAEMAIEHKGLHVDRRDAVLPFVAPHHLDASCVLPELEQEVLLLKATDVEVVANLNRLHDDRSVVGVVGCLPQQPAGLGLDGIHPARLHQDQLPHPGGLKDHRRAVALLKGCAGSPDLLTSVLVEGHRVGHVCARDADQPVAVYEWVAGVAPGGRLGAVVGRQVARPEQRAVGNS